MRVRRVQSVQSAREAGGRGVTQAREHRGSLHDSMATAKPCATRAELLARVRESLEPYAREVPDEALHVEPYRFDERIGWDTYLVTIDGYGVWGMTDGPA